MSSSTFHLTSLPSNDHIMLLYSSDAELINVAASYINNGLKSGHQCIYASLNVYDSKSSSNISNLSSKIGNYKGNIESGELQIVDFKPYYESALQGDLSTFNNLKIQWEKTQRQRISEGKKDAILAFADTACFLSQNKHFEECKVLEKWWHNTTTEWAQNNRNITVVCPHPGVVLNDPILSDTKGRLNEMHTITIDLKQSTAENQQKKKEKRTQRILIAEPNSDIQYLYSLFANQYGFSISDMNIVANGNKCIEILLSNTVEKKEEEDNNNGDNNNNNNNDYDIIILDTHLPDISGFEVARKIRDRLPHKRIILTTTYSLDNISSMIDSIGIKSQDVLFKPFIFSELFSILKEPRMSYN